MNWKIIRDYPMFALSVLLGLFIILITTPEGILFTLLGVTLCLSLGTLGLAIVIGCYLVFYLTGQYVVLLNSKVDIFLRLIDRKHDQ